MTNGAMPRILRRSVCAATIAATMTISVAAEAHGIWFAQRAKQLALIYGVGADDLDMVRRSPRWPAIRCRSCRWGTFPQLWERR